MDKNNLKLAEEKYARLLHILYIVILVLGLGLRFYQHFMGRSLWEDETHFALNFIKYDFMRLTKPLDDLQAGPILFLWGVKAFAEIFGYTELAFRSLTWLTCILTLPLFYFLTLQLTKSRIASLLAFLMFSINISLIYFSSELKPYGIDVAVYVLMTYLVLSTNAYVTRHRHALLAIGGVLCLLLSNVSFIVLFCVGLYIFLSWYNNRKIDFRDLLVMGVWAIVFGINYYIFIHDHPSTTWQRINYTYAFCPTDPLSCEFLTFMKQRLNEIFYVMLLYIWRMYFISYVLLLIFIVATRKMINERQYPIIIFTWLPILMHLVLSAMNLYPFWYRLILYLVPCFIIIISYGSYLIAAYLSKRIHIVAGVLFLAYCTFFFTKENIRNFPLWELEIKPALDYLKRETKPGTHVYITTPANAYRYYHFRGYARDSIYRQVPWTLTPEEFYYITSQEKSNYVLFYHTGYQPGHEAVVKDIRDKNLIEKEFVHHGYTVAIVKPKPIADSIYKEIDLTASFNKSPNDNSLPLWGGEITSNPIALPKGKYTMHFVSKGSSMEGVPPQNSVSVNGKPIGIFTTPTPLPAINESLPFENDRDSIIIKIRLDNDNSNATEDRNTFIEKIVISKQ